MRFQIADDVRVWPVSERGERVYRIEVPRTHQFFRVGYREYFLLSLFDGSTTLPQACSLATARLGRDAPTVEEANTIVQWLLQNQIIRNGDASTVNRTVESTPDERPLWQRFNPFWIKVALPKAQRWIEPVATKLSPLMGPAAVVIALILGLIALAIFLTRREEFLGGGSDWLHPSRWIWMGAIFVGLKLVHEWGHAIACYRQGCRVSQAGMVFVLFAPLAYVDVTSCWRLPSRWDRFLVSAAGMFVELFVASMAMIIWSMQDDSLLRSTCQGIVVTAGISTLLFNGNVLMRFDGYHVLADWVDIPNLATESQQCVMRFFRRWMFGDDDQGGGRFFGWRRGFIVVYGTAAMVWKLVVCLSLFIAASAMFQGAGVVIAALGIVMWFGVPLMRWTRMMVDLRRRRVTQFYRGCVLGSIGALMLFLILFRMPFPTSIRIPVITQYTASSLVRVRVSGFVDKIHVHDGQSVARGDRLMSLRNDELTEELHSLELNRQGLELQRLKAGHEMKSSDVLVLKQELIGVNQQLAQLRQRTEALLVRAPQDGRVAARDLSLFHGSYLNEGDPVMNIAGKDDVEWVALISPQHVQKMGAIIGESIDVRTPSHQSFASRFERVEPSASDRLGYPALAAVYGGPLITKRDDRDSRDDHPNDLAMRLAQPHFQARLRVPRSVEPIDDSQPGQWIGMRLVAYAGSDTTPVAIRLRRYVRSLWHDAHRLR